MANVIVYFSLTVAVIAVLFTWMNIEFERADIEPRSVIPKKQSEPKFSPESIFSAPVPESPEDLTPEKVMQLFKSRESFDPTSGTSSDASVKRTPAAPEYADDQYIIVMKKTIGGMPVRAKNAFTAASQLEAEPQSQFKDVQSHIAKFFNNQNKMSAASVGTNGASANKVHKTFKFGYHATIADQKLLQDIKNDDDVALVERDSKAFALNEDFLAKSWGLDRIDQPFLPLDQNYFVQKDAGKDVDIYVLDTGVNIGLEEFAGRGSLGVNTIVGEDHIDFDGHGTHVASTTAGTTYGVAKKANVWSVKVLNAQGWGYWSGIIQGIDWVTENHKRRVGEKKARASIINMSLGGSGQLEAMKIAVDAATQAGVAVIVAAGNSFFADACFFTPAGVSSAFTVAASDRSDGTAFFSNVGPCVDIFAPGVDILAFTPSGFPRSLSGTSMASPHVAGVAAILQSKEATSVSDLFSRLTALSVKDIIRNPSGSPNLLLQVPPRFIAKFGLGRISSESTVLFEFTTNLVSNCTITAENCKNERLKVVPSDGTFIGTSTVAVFTNRGADLETLVLNASCISSSGFETFESMVKHRRPLSVRLTSNANMLLNGRRTTPIVVRRDAFFSEGDTVEIPDVGCVVPEPSIIQVPTDTDPINATFNLHSDCFFGQNTVIQFLVARSPFDFGNITLLSRTFRVDAIPSQVALNFGNYTGVAFDPKSVASYTAIIFSEITPYRWFSSVLLFDPNTTGQALYLYTPPEFQCQNFTHFVKPTYFLYNKNLKPVGGGQLNNRMLRVSTRASPLPRFNFTAVNFGKNSTNATLTLDIQNTNFTLPGSKVFISPFYYWVNTSGIAVANSDRFFPAFTEGLVQIPIYLNNTRAPATWTQRVQIVWGSGANCGPYTFTQRVSFTRSV